MRAFIYVGGAVNAAGITEHPKGDDLTVAADSGYDNALTLGESVAVYIGDMDSVSAKPAEGIEVVHLKPEKNMTDTQAAVELAVERGADELIIVGGLSGRLDHTMANLGILEDAYERRLHALITDGNNRVRFIRNDSTLLARSRYKYFGLVAADEKVTGVEIQGAKYPLKNAKLKRNFQYAVSNEVVGNCALIAVKRGGLFIIESN